MKTMLVRRSSAAVFNHSFGRIACLRACSIEARTKDDSSVVCKEEITIPYRIHRGPTDILKALASTVKKDPLAPHFKYEDDPYLIPVSNVSKRSYALSKEAGKKAARYFLETYPELFKCHKADPPIKAFDPPTVYTEKDEVSDDTLKSCIKESDVTNSLTVYKLLKERNLPCSKETKQALLELLCFYNSEQPSRTDYVEERWYSLKERPKNTWKNNGEADKLFQEMEKDSDAYAAIIQGTAKFLNVDRAMSLYEEMCGKEFKGNLAMYNSLLNIVPYVKQDGDMRWEVAMDYVKSMNMYGIAPDLRTMNALLNVASKSRRWNKARAITMQILAEMKRIKIEPSLGSYYHVLTVFCLNSRDHYNALRQILNKIEGKEFSMQHPDDIHFFSTAMEVCNNVYGSKEMAYKINNLLEIGKNCAFLGNALNESIYFRHFFMLLCSTEDFDKFMEVYQRYIPNAYTPEPSIMLEIIKTLDFSGSYTHLPQICSDVLMFEHTEREEILSELTKVAAGAKLEEKFQEMLSNIMWEILEKLEIRAETQMVKRVTWTGNLLGDFLKTFLNSNDLEKIWHVIQKLKNQEEHIVGYPTSECLLQVCLSFLKAKDFEKLKFSVKYAKMTAQISIEEDILKCAEELIEAGELKKNHENELRSIIKIEDNDKESETSLEQAEKLSNKAIEN